MAGLLTARRVRRPSIFHHPARVVVGGFGLAILVGTALLSLPIATTAGTSPGLMPALFTATSAACVTGLTMVDTAAHWSVFGEIVIAALIKMGGLGIMTLATLFTVLIARKLKLRTQMIAQVETRAMNMSDVRRVVRNVVLFSLFCETIAGTILTARFVIAYDEPFWRGLYLGFFHSISAFNNAGFALWPDGLVRFATDPWICLTIAIAVIVGGLGFPVIFELVRLWRHPGRWSVLTRVTMFMTTVLLAGGTLIFLSVEWHNPKTLGAIDDPGKLLVAFFAAVMPRSGGFNSIDIASMEPSSWLATELLMFIGGGSAGTAGGIKVTTFGLIVLIVWAEMRGENHVNVGHRRLSSSVQRQAVVITAMSAALVVVSTYVLLLISPHDLERVLFEVVSATGVVGLSTGITADLPQAGQVLLLILMFIGRIGPLTLGSALALKERSRRYELPEERVIVG
ncbi:TrkH family potassium uptake protein [Herbidospora mongoliensis]|uniref:TrkH family potassium uptake protein n=1 Tax=Herbidospora mongoliensis TaxID=688067 RepID=UPI00082ED15F|nr:potassium transporter TrkG [Herbidospora mongoliensis]